MLAIGLFAAANVYSETWVATNPPLPSAYEHGFQSGNGAGWIHTNAFPAKGPFDYLKEIELTPSLDASVPHASAYYNNAFRLLLRQRPESLVLQAHGAATYGGRIVMDYDIRDMSGVKTNGLTEKEIYLASRTSETHMTVGYYRGRLIYELPFRANDKWTTLFSSEDHTKLVSIADDGPIYFSEDSGLTWQVISTPGRYEFTLAVTPKLSAIVASVSVRNAPAALDLDEVQKIARANWYAVVSSANGNKLVITGGPSQSAPVLSITPSVNGVILSWPSSYTNFVVQQNGDLTTTNWVNATNPVNQVGGQNRVTISEPIGNTFFRLKAQ